MGYDIGLVLSGKFPKTKRPAAGVVAVLVLAVIIGGVVINNSKKAATEKARMELLTRQKAEDDKRRIAEATKKAELEKQKAAESAAKLEKDQQELWDATAKFANQALVDNSNFDAATAGFEKIKANCKGTKFESMADTEIAKLAKAKSDLAEEQRKKAEEEKRVAAEAAKKVEGTAKTEEDTAKVEDPEATGARDVNTNEKDTAEDVSSGEPVRIAVPSGDAVKGARAALRETFKDDFAKKKDEDKLAFSESLREAAATEKDAVQKYALFVEAIALATDAGNTDEAFAAVTELCVVFDAVAMSAL